MALRENKLMDDVVKGVYLRKLGRMNIRYIKSTTKYYRTRIKIVEFLTQYGIKGQNKWE